jgi:hypothetical protein
MAITTLPGKGTLLQLKVTSTYYTIGQRVSIDGPDPELKMRDTTHLDSTMVTSRPAIPDPGTISGTLLFDPNDSTTTVNHPVIRAKVLTPPSSPDEWKLVYADGKTTPANDVFLGYITKWKVSGIEVEGSLQAEWEIRITDTFTITAGGP